MIRMLFENGEKLILFADSVVKFNLITWVDISINNYN
jgi:hypothetical protein